MSVNLDKSTAVQCTCRDCMSPCYTATAGGWTLCADCLDAGCTPLPPATGEWPGRRPDGDYECLRVTSSEPTPAVHIHVGHNMPGYLPESEPMCFDNVADALQALRHEIKDQQDYYWEGCTAETPEQQEEGSDCCEWCSVALDCEAALSAIADSGPDQGFVSEGRAAWIFSPPQGADMHHWAVSMLDPREDCEIFADQEQ